MRRRLQQHLTTAGGDSVRCEAEDCLSIGVDAPLRARAAAGGEGSRTASGWLRRCERRRRRCRSLSRGTAAAAETDVSAIGGVATRTVDGVGGGLRRGHGRTPAVSGVKAGGGHLHQPPAYTRAKDIAQGSRSVLWRGRALRSTLRHAPPTARGAMMAVTQQLSPFCQSCAMPLSKPDDFGPEANGFWQNDYCSYCSRVRSPAHEPAGVWAPDHVLRGAAVAHNQYCAFHVSGAG